MAFKKYLFCYAKERKHGGYIGYQEIDHSQKNAGAFETRELPGELDVTKNIETYTHAGDEIIEQDIRSKLNRAEREKVLAAIKAKQASIDQEVNKKMGIEHEGQALITQQIQQVVRQAAQEAPPTIAHGPIRALLVWILKNLPDRVYRLTSAAVILGLALSACSAINRTDIDPGQISPTATEAPFVPDTGGQEIPAEPAEVVPALSPVENLYNQYFAGEKIDVSTLSEEEWVELSIKLAEKKNQARGINPIIYNNEAYVSPDNYMLMNYDGHPDMSETIEMFVPIVGKDENGNLQFENKGETITIPGSAEMDWNMIVSSTQDTRIDWPQTEPLKSGLTDVEQKLDMFGVVLTPMIMLDKDLGQFYLSGEGSVMQSTLKFLKIETDAVGNPIYARRILLNGVSFWLYEEGSALFGRSSINEIEEWSSFYNELSENIIYYVGGSSNPVKTYDSMKVSIEGYKGIVPTSDIRPVLLGEKQNDKDILVSPTVLLIIKATN